MKRAGKRKLGRIKRGENYAPGRYWLNFMVFSVVVHAVTLMVMSDVALSFIQSLRKPEPPAQALMYVNLLYSTPAPLQPGEAPRDSAAPAAPAHGHANERVRPDRHVVTRPEPPHAMPEDADLRVKPQTVQEPEPHDTAIRETAVLESVDSGTIQLITGTKKTDITLADIAEQKPAQAEPPVVLNSYSSARISSAVHAPPTSPATAPKQLGTLTQPAQSSTLDRKAEETPLVPAFSQPTLGNSSSVTNTGRDATQPGDKGPLPSPAMPFKTHTSVPPSPAAMAPRPSPPKVITITGPRENAGKPLKIKITAPRGGITDKSLIDITGEVEGDGINSVGLSIRGDKRELLVRGGVFRTTARLEEGRNEIRAEASDQEGRASSDSITVTYVPAFAAARISFISPMKDGVIDAMKEKRLLIYGVVEGQNIGTVRVYLNKTVMDIEVKDGRFRETAPLEAERNMLYAEATDGSGTTIKSEKITFSVLNLYPKDLTVRMEFSGTGGVPGVKYRFAPHPLSEKTGRLQAAPEFFADAGPDGGVVSVGEAVPGIYTVGVEYDTGPGEAREATFKVTLYGYDPSRKKTRTIGPVKLRGKGYLPAVRVLLPEEVFWEDDGWFSGRMESGSGTMKFKEPEGIVWKEEE